MKVWSQYREVIRVNWHHGFTCFGGPAVQFQTFHEKFVNKLGWIDESMYQQIFCLSQSLPGSASVKMLFCINSVHSDMVAGTIATVLFCLPGAIGMYALSLGISRVGNTLPAPVYALLSGLNAATVGIIALAGVRLAARAISDKITRFWVYLGGFLGMLYSALWYYPVLLVCAGISTLLFDFRYPHRICNWCKCLFTRLRSRRSPKVKTDVEKQAKHFTNDDTSFDLEKPLPALPRSARSSWPESPSDSATMGSKTLSDSSFQDHHSCCQSQTCICLDTSGIPAMTWQLGSSIIALFLLTFILVIALSHLLHPPTRLLSLFAALYQAGTIIVGGGPVVIPLLESYLVDPGWVHPRDFLLGLAVIQAFPGPNFNFAVYLGALAVAGTPFPSYLGALVAFVGMYGPGVFIMVGFMGLWRVVQGKKWFEATQRGVNAAAVGLVFTAVWRLWEIGCLKPDVQGGSPLGMDPWLVGISGTAYVGNAWFGLNPPVAILLGGSMGVGRWGVIEIRSILQHR